MLAGIWLEYGLLGLIWGLPSWNLAFGGLLRLNLNSYYFLGLFVFCCTLVASLPTNLFTLSAHLLINTVSTHARRSVTGGPPLSGALSLYPFGIKESPNGTSLAMYPLVDFAFKAQGYVSKGPRFLSDAPFGQFP